MFVLVRTHRFDRRLREFVRKHPDLRRQLAQIFRDLSDDPFQPSLHLHPLRGDLEVLHAVRVTYTYRMTLTLRLTHSEIVLIDIGSHDEVYG